MYRQRERVRATAVSFSLLVMLVGLAGVHVDAVPVAAAEDFSLVDEGGQSLTDLGVDPDIAPARVGLDPAHIVHEHNLLGLVSQHAAAVRELWCWYVVVSLGFLLLSVQLARAAPRGTRCAPFESVGLMLWFGTFACWHWTAVATVSAQHHLLAAALRHTAAHADAPDLLVALAATAEPVSRTALAVVHIGLDLAVLLGLGVIACGLRCRPYDAA